MDQQRKNFMKQEENGNGNGKEGEREASCVDEECSLEADEIENQQRSGNDFSRPRRYVLSPWHSREREIKYTEYAANDQLREFVLIPPAHWLCPFRWRILLHGTRKGKSIRTALSSALSSSMIDEVGAHKCAQQLFGFLLGTRRRAIVTADRGAIHEVE
jgi:hypothetical protein